MERRFFYLSWVWIEQPYQLKTWNLVPQWGQKRTFCSCEGDVASAPLGASGVICDCPTFAGELMGALMGALMVHWWVLHPYPFYCPCQPDCPQEKRGRGCRSRWNLLSYTEFWLFDSHQESSRQIYFLNNSHPARSCARWLYWFTIVSCI